MLKKLFSWVNYIELNKETAEKSSVWWFVESLPYTIPAALAVYSTYLMILLLADSLNSTAVLLGLPLFIATFFYALSHTKGMRLPGSIREARIVGLLILAFVSGWVVFNAQYNAENVFVFRDPGIYTVNGSYLIENDNLAYQATNVFGEDPSIMPNGASFGGLTPDDDNFYVHGGSLLPTLLGLSGRVGGQHALFNANLLIGGLALLSLFGMARLIVKPRWALLATVVLGLSLPMIYFSRDTYTEPISLLTVFGALSLSAIAFSAKARDNWGILAISGVAMGATTYARIDSFLTLASFIAFVAIVIIHDRASKKEHVWRRVGVYASFAFLTSVLGWRLFTDLGAKYYHDLHMNFMPQIYLLIVAAGASIVAVLTFKYWKKLTKHYKKHAKVISALAVIAIGLFIIGLASRPLWMTSYTKSQSGLIGALQAAEGHKVEPRDYTELSLHWMWWYIGPMAALFGSIGVLQAVGKSFKKMDYTLSVLLLVFIIPAMVYFVRPSIAADQIWVIRRYLPVILPGILIFSAIGMQQLELRLTKFKTRNLILAGLAYLMIHPVGFIAGPFYKEREFANMYDRIDRTCELLPEDAAVLLLGNNGLNMLQSVRVYCDVPAERLIKPSPDILAGAATAAINNGYTPYVLVDKRERPVVAGEATLTLVDDTLMLEYQKAATRPPRALSLRSRTFYLGELNQDGTINHLDGTEPDIFTPSQTE